MYTQHSTALSMSLYTDALSFLTNPPSAGGSFKSRIYNQRNIRSSPAQIYALIVESAKWDILLKEVIERAETLKYEPKVGCRLSLWIDAGDGLADADKIALAPSVSPPRP